MKTASFAVCVCVCGEQAFLDFLSAVLDVDGGEIEDSTRVPCVTMALLLPNACSKYGRTVQVRSPRTLLATMDHYFNIPHTTKLVQPALKRENHFNNAVQIEVGAHRPLLQDV